MRRTLLLALLLMVGCKGSSEGPVRERPRPNVVVVCVDTLRRDRLGCYGYDQPITPHLDALAKTAVLYTRAYATSPWTLPSHASAFTGLYPFEHGAHTYHVDQSREGIERGARLHNNVMPLLADATTLAERFKAAGYSTGAFVANTVFLDPRYGLAQGFDTYQVIDAPIQELNASIFEWLDRVEGEPFFLFVNTMDTHAPYNTRPRPDHLVTVSPEESIEQLRALYAPVLDVERPLPEAELAAVSAQYDLAVANLDSGLGELVSEVQRRGLFTDMLLLVTADHGEYFGEHRLIEHSKDVYEEALAVPFLLKRPGQNTGEVEDRLVSLAHLPYLVSKISGALPTDVWPHAWPAATILAENHYSRLKDMRSPWAGRFLRSRLVIYEGSLKYIQSTDGRHELYDLQADPREQINLVQASDARLESIRSSLLGHLQAAGLAWSEFGRRLPPTEIPTLSPQEIERLRSLGYL